MIKNENEIKVGDLVTGKRNNILEDGLAEVLSITGEDITVKVIESNNKYLKVGQIDSGWMSGLLTKVEKTKIEESVVVIKEEIKVGDKVKIREWDDMKKEFGCSSKVINCPYAFTEPMRKFCGDTFIVGGIDGDMVRGADNGYTITLDMIEKVSAIHKIKFKVTIDGRKTTVKTKDGKIGMSSCLPEDEQNEYEGIRIALARAYGVDPFPTIATNAVTEEPVPVVTEEPIKPKKLSEDFKVGDRVKVASTCNSFSSEVLVGAEGTIIDISGGALVIKFDIHKGTVRTQRITVNLGCLEVIDKPITEDKDEKVDYDLSYVMDALSKLGISTKGASEAIAGSFKKLDEVFAEIKEQAERKDVPFKGFKVGDTVSREMAIEILKAKGKVRAGLYSKLVYFEENGVLKFINENGIIDKSTGYVGNINGHLTIVELPAKPAETAEKPIMSMLDSIIGEMFKTR